MFRIVLLNLGFLAITAIPVFIPQLFGSMSIEFVLRILGIFLVSIYLAAAAISVKSISDYGSFGFGDFFRNLKIAWPAGLVMGIVFFIIFSIAVFVIPFYMEIDSLLGLALAAIVFWTIIFALLSFQFYFAARARLGTHLGKLFKKCLLIFLDNSGLSVLSFLHNIIALVISIFLAFLFPGPAGVLLFLDEALRLRLMKYDWLEANPEANRRKIPWEEILVEEREKTGNRTFRNFIFPWKD